MTTPGFPPFLVLLAGSWCLAAFAEVPSPDEPPLLVQRFGWRKEGIAQPSQKSGSFRADAGLDQPNLTAVMESEGMDSTGRRQSRARKTLLDAGKGAPADPAGETPAKEWYRYDATLWNRGTVSAQFVVWDYLFREPESLRVITRIRFRSEVTIRPGKKKSLEGFTTQPPGTVASVAALKDACRQCEFVEIERIVFADKSVWQRR